MKIKMTDQAFTDFNQSEKVQQRKSQAQEIDPKRQIKYLMNEKKSNLNQLENSFMFMMTKKFPTEKVQLSKYTSFQK